MDLLQRIEICKVCNNKGFSAEKGVYCSLTDDKPEFEADCEKFDGNKLQKELAMAQAVANAQERKYEASVEKASSVLNTIGFLFSAAFFIALGIMMYNDPTGSIDDNRGGRKGMFAFLLNLLWSESVGIFLGAVGCCMFIYKVAMIINESKTKAAKNQ